MSIAVFGLCQTYITDRSETAWERGGREIVEALHGEVVESIRGLRQHPGVTPEQVALKAVSFNTVGEEFQITAHMDDERYSINYRMALRNPLDVSNHVIPVKD